MHNAPTELTQEEVKLSDPEKKTSAPENPAPGMEKTPEIHLLF